MARLGIMDEVCYQKVRLLFLLLSFQHACMLSLAALPAARESLHRLMTPLNAP